MKQRVDRYGSSLGLACAFLLAGCGSERRQCEPGSAGCECRSDDGCEQGLVCLSRICVVGDNAGESGMTPDGGAGRGADGGASGAGGMDGAAGEGGGAEGGTAGTGPQAECGALDAPEHGSVEFETTTQGSVATYDCEGGYGLVGVASRACEAGGAWSDAAPTCAPGDCESLASPSNGTVTTPDGTTVGASATYSCAEGHSLNGDASRTCEEGSVWSGSEPSCAPVDCGALTAPASGSVDTQAGTTFGASASYACNSGYTIAGSATRTCAADGSWSDAEPTCAPVDCGALTAPASGDVDTSGGTTFGSSATYSCDTGYGLVGVASRSCGADAEWSDQAPTCALGDCASLASPANGTVRTPNGTTYGASATYSCNDGYELTGSASRMCESNATWSGSAPTCQLVDCGSLSNPTNGTISAPSGTTYDQIATYRCNPGYYLSGNATRTCQASGSWSGSAPSCPDANTEQLRLTQLHVGSSEFVRITNRGGNTATLTGVRLELRDSSGTTYTYDFTSGTLAAGATAQVGEGAASSYALSLNLAGARAATVLVCAGSPCSSSTVLDALVFEADGGTMVAPALPAGVSINGPLHGIGASNDDLEDFYRVAYNGAAPSFTNCDWSAAPQMPIFVESFECGTSRWTLVGGTFNTPSGAPDGSASYLNQTAGSIDPSSGLWYSFPAAIRPTHIEYWTYPAARFFLCSPNACDIGVTLYWNYTTNLCFLGETTSCNERPANSWTFVEIEDINWNTGTADFYVAGSRIADNAAFGTTYMDNSGLVQFKITGGQGRTDGIRVW